MDPYFPIPRDKIVVPGVLRHFKKAPRLGLKSIRRNGLAIKVFIIRCAQGEIPPCLSVFFDFLFAELHAKLKHKAFGIKIKILPMLQKLSYDPFEFALLKIARIGFSKGVVAALFVFKIGFSFPTVHRR